MSRPPLLRCPHDCRRSTFPTLRALNIHISKMHSREQEVTVRDFFRLLEVDYLAATIQSLRKSARVMSQSQR
jgi:hypothetical protein